MNDDNFKIENNGNEKFLIKKNLFALNKTTALLQDIWSAFYDDTKIYFRESFKIKLLLI